MASKAGKTARSDTVRRGARRPRRLKISSSAKRIRIFMVIGAIAMTLVAGRAIQLQGIDAAAHAQAAAAKMTYTRDLAPNRGTITDRNGVILAETEPAVRVIADPWAIATNGLDRRAKMTNAQKKKAEEAPAAIAEILVQYLGGNKDAYLAQLTRERRDGEKPNQYEVLATKVTSWTYQQISDALREGGWYGIYKEDAPIRRYPASTVASNVVGYVNGEGKGLGGLEYSRNEQLQGIKGQESYQTSVYGRIPLGDETLIPAIDGTSHQLTIDSELQFMAEQELGQAMRIAGAKTGTVVIMDVKNGEVLAMANAPTFDSGDFTEAKPADMGNRAITDAYEPGSVHKVLTMAALLDTGAITPDTRVVVPPSIKSGGGEITDSFKHGEIYLTARGVLAQSSNMGTVLLARQVPKATLVDYYSAFGLGQPTGIELPGEGKGTLGIVPAASMPDYTRDQIVFGQGISVTALQEAAALAAAVNGGVYNAPTIIRTITNGDGTDVPVTRPTPRRVISEESSAQLLNMMEAVMAAPEYAARRMVPGYRVAGKSGTAERIDRRTGRYSGYTSSFVTVAPVSDPQILVYVVLDQPSNGLYGSVLAMPSAKALISLALPRYGIAPSTEIPVYDDPLVFRP